MSKQTSQTGSAHMVVIICLVLVLLTALGWIFWQNFIYKAPATSDHSAVSTKKSAKQSAADTKLTEKCLQKEKLCMKIPASLTADFYVEPAGEGTPERDLGTIKTQSGMEILSFGTGDVQGSNGCTDTSAQSGLDVIEAVKTNVQAKEADETTGSRDIYAIKAVYQDPAHGVYEPYELLSNYIDKIGFFHTCRPDSSAAFRGQNVGPDGYGFVTISSAPFNNVKNKTYDSKAAAEQVLNSKDYTDAFMVLRSVHY